MERIDGLGEYVKQPAYRRALGLPERVTETYSLLAAGEYNVNYLFTHPVTGQELLLRVNCGSQMHLDDQIGYEYKALKLLERSARTPRALYVDGSRSHIAHGVLVMEYLPGHALGYSSEYLRAADILADIHGMKTRPDEAAFLLSPEQPLHAMLAECRGMVAHYFASPLADKEKSLYIDALLKRGERMAGEDGLTCACCINTELNSTNFLINADGGRDYLIDWEKPLYGDPAQDIGHFLAPTTTFWKSDVIFDADMEAAFTKRYIEAVDARFDTAGIAERVKRFIPITCLRGITWCAMAWIEYREPGRAIRNASTAKKLDQYLSMDFLRMIGERYFT